MNSAFFHVYRLFVPVNRWCESVSKSPNRFKSVKIDRLSFYLNQFINHCHESSCSVKIISALVMFIRIGEASKRTNSRQPIKNTRVPRWKGRSEPVIGCHNQLRVNCQRIENKEFVRSVSTGAIMQYAQNSIKGNKHGRTVHCQWLRHSSRMHNRIYRRSMGERATHAMEWQTVVGISLMFQSGCKFVLADDFGWQSILLDCFDVWLFLYQFSIRFNRESYISSVWHLFRQFSVCYEA